MGSEKLLALVMFVCVASLTPGPNNIMLMASGVNYGFRRTLPHMAGVTLGFMLMLAIVGAGLGQVFLAVPGAHLALSVVSIVYLLWLAWKLARARAVEDGQGSGAGRPMSFMQAAAFQWVNPKAWVFALSVCGAYLDPKAFSASFIAVLAVCGLVSVPCVALWAGFGAALSRFLAHPLWVRVFNLVMAGLLVLSLAPIIMDVLRYTRLTAGAL